MNKVLLFFAHGSILVSMLQCPECSYIHDGKSRKHNIRRIRKTYPLLNYETIRYIKRKCPNL